MSATVPVAGATAASETLAHTNATGTVAPHGALASTCSQLAVVHLLRSGRGPANRAVQVKDATMLHPLRSRGGRGEGRGEVRAPGALAFTRLHLVIILASVALLALLALAWRSRAADLPRRQVCQKNVRELLRGFEDYSRANGRLPWAARSGTTNAEDWIHWQTDRALAGSALARYLTNFDSRILRCPGDTGYRHREYPHSYSMNAFLEKLPLAVLPTPNELILIYEEYFPNDGACAAGEIADALATRHTGRSHAGFLDGHVERVTRSTGAAAKHARPFSRFQPNH